MLGKWRQSEPSHVFDAKHLKIDYDAGEEFAKGFILFETKHGVSRKYLYEAFFRNAKWNIAFTTGDPENTKPFSDRDRGIGRFRELNGVPKFHRQDIARELNVKLGRFRDNILLAERNLQKMTAEGRFLQTGLSGDDYWLHGGFLIRVQRSPLRDIFVAKNLGDICLDDIVKYVV